MARKKTPPIAGRRIQYVRMIGGWGYGAILGINENGDLVAHLDCQGKGEEWIIPRCALGKRYFLCTGEDVTQERGDKNG